MIIREKVELNGKNTKNEMKVLTHENSLIRLIMESLFFILPLFCFNFMRDNFADITI